MFSKYIDIYFILKITYPISTLPEHLHSTIPNTNRMEGCAIYKQKEAKLVIVTQQTLTHRGVRCRGHVPGGVL